MCFNLISFLIFRYNKGAFIERIWFQLLDDTDTAVQGVLRRFYEACILGVQKSDNRTTDEALVSRNESLAANETSYISINDTNQATQLSAATYEVMQEIVDQICLGQPACSGNGTCNGTVCNCYPGRHSAV